MKPLRLAVAAKAAKAIVDRRGGTQGLKRDAGRLRRIASSDDSVSHKAKRAAEALRHPTGTTGGGRR